jgi:hypothetical protein
MTRHVTPIVIAVLAGAGCWFFGLAVVPSLVVVLVLAAVGIALRTVILPTGNIEWPPAPPASIEGLRREASELAWAIRGPRGIVDERIIERVRRIAIGSLNRRHLDVYSPRDRTRIESLIGASMYAFLSSRDRASVKLPTLLSMLNLLESLEKTDPAARN